MTPDYINPAEIVGANEPDPDSSPGNGVGNGEDDEASASTLPTGSADLSLSMAVSNPTPLIGSNIVISLTVANGGPSAATGVTTLTPPPVTGLGFLEAVLDADIGCSCWSYRARQDQ